MKNYKSLLVVVLVLLQAVSWYTFIGNVEVETVGVQRQQEQAQTYVEEGLYQKAIDEYSAILAIQDSKETRLSQIEAYYLLYDENHYSSVRRRLEACLEDFLFAYPKEAEPYEQLAGYYYETARNDEKAIEYIQRANSQDIYTERLDALWQEVRFAYRLKNIRYMTVTGWLSGYSTVMRDDRYAICNTAGKQVLGLNYTYAGPMFNNLALVKTENTTFLIDSGGTAQLVLDNKYTWAGIYNGGLLPVASSEGYAYIDAGGQEKHGGYDFAGTMQYGSAAVQRGGVWQIIDADGNLLQETDFEDIVLDFAGCYNQFASVPALKDGKYRLYDPATMQPVSDFSCDAIDGFYADGIAAFEKNGKWGFVDASGNIVMEPVYEAARSFSAGFAAVCSEGKWGFIDTSGTLVIDTVFVDALYFNSNRTCWVYHNGNWDILYFLVDA